VDAGTVAFAADDVVFSRRVEEFSNTETEIFVTFVSKVIKVSFHNSLSNSSNPFKRTLAAVAVALPPSLGHWSTRRGSSDFR